MESYKLAACLAPFDALSNWCKAHLVEKRVAPDVEEELRGPPVVVCGTSSSQRACKCVHNHETLRLVDGAYSIPSQRGKGSDMWCVYYGGGGSIPHAHLDFIPVQIKKKKAESDKRKEKAPRCNY